MDSDQKVIAVLIGVIVVLLMMWGSTNSHLSQARNDYQSDQQYIATLHRDFVRPAVDLCNSDAVVSGNDPAVWSATLDLCNGVNDWAGF